MFSFTSGAITDRGDIRAENQDSILRLSGNIGGQAAALFVVADGMGGLSHGAQVSQYITAQFERWWYEDFTQLLMEGMDQEGDIRELLEQEIWDINQAILDFRTRMQCRSGSTLSLLLLYKNQYFIENIGDSRIYLARKRKLLQLTKDQSLAAQMVRDHRMTEEEAKHSKVKHMLTMCMGMFSVPQSNYATGRLYHKDCYLLCSDGLYQPLRREQIEHVLKDYQFNPQEKVNQLRQMIDCKDASDNISAIAVNIRKEREAKGGSKT